METKLVKHRNLLSEFITFIISPLRKLINKERNGCFNSQFINIQLTFTVLLLLNFRNRVVKTAFSCLEIYIQKCAQFVAIFKSVTTFGTISSLQTQNIVFEGYALS